MSVSPSLALAFLVSCPPDPPSLFLVAFPVCLVFTVFCKMEEERGRAWLPAMVRLMVEVFNQMRCDKPNDPEEEVHKADVPLPLQRDNCK